MFGKKKSESKEESKKKIFVARTNDKIVGAFTNSAAATAFCEEHRKISEDLIWPEPAENAPDGMEVLETYGGIMEPDEKEKVEQPEAAPSTEQPAGEPIPEVATPEATPETPVAS